MKLSLIISILLFLISTSSYSQRWMRDREHIVLGLGASGFMGDLGGAEKPSSTGIRDFDLNAAKPTVMLAYRYYLMEVLALRGNVIYGQISGDDNHTDEIYRNNRNIHFRSPIVELSAQGEFYFYKAERVGARYRRLTRGRGWIGYNISGYIFAGIGGFYFNPEAQFDRDTYLSLEHATIRDLDLLPSNGWHELRPLKTEGQDIIPTRKSYSQIQVSVPLGIGAFFQINRELAVGIEFGFRKTWTDYIDDVSTTYIDPSIYSKHWDDPKKIALAEYFSNPTNNSLGTNVTAPGQQRGGPAYNDFYMFSLITVFYKFPDIRPTHGIPRF